MKKYEERKRFFFPCLHFWFFAGYCFLFLVAELGDLEKVWKKWENKHTQIECKQQTMRNHLIKIKLIIRKNAVTAIFERIFGY